MLHAPHEAQGSVAVFFLRCNQDDSAGIINPDAPASEAGIYRLVGDEGVFVDRGDGFPVNPIAEARRLANADSDEVPPDQSLSGDEGPARAERLLAVQARQLTMEEFLRGVIDAGS
jgi:hypothetical protein